MSTRNNRLKSEILTGTTGQLITAGSTAALLSFDAGDYAPLAIIDGDAGNNTLTGTSGADLMNGYAGNDTLNALGGDDTLIGGADNDTLRGGDGNDVYNFEVGDGTDYIEELAGEGSDTIALGAGISASALRFFKLSNGNAGAEDLLVFHGADQITIADQYDRNTGVITPKIEVLTLHGGGSINLDFDVLTFEGLPTTGTVVGTEGNDIVIGNNNATTTQVLKAYGGDDTYRITTDLLTTSEIFFRIEDLSETTVETLELPVGVTLGDLRFFKLANGQFGAEDLQIFIGDNKIQIDNQYDRIAGDLTHKIETLQFSDLSTRDMTVDGLTFEGLSTTGTVVGTSGNDTIIGNGELFTGQTLRGYEGDDTYVIETDFSGVTGYVQTVIETSATETESLELLNGLGLSDLRFFKGSKGNFSSEDLQIWIGDDQIILTDQYDRNTAAPATKIETLILDNGSTLIDLETAKLTFEGLATTGTISGTTLDDFIIGNGELTTNQALRGYEGEDDYIITTDFTGASGYRFTVYEDSVINSETLDLQGLGLSDLRFFKGSKGNFGSEDLQIWIDDDLITIDNQYFRTDASPDTRIETLILDNGGTLIDLATAKLTFEGLSSTGTISGTTLEDVIIGNGTLTTNQFLRGYESDDDYIITTDFTGVTGYRFQIEETNLVDTDSLDLQGLALADLRFFKGGKGNFQSEDLQIWIGDDLITIENQYIRVTAAPDTKIETLILDNGGTLIDLANDKLTFEGLTTTSEITGTTQDDCLIANGEIASGAQNLRGYEGDDTYIVTTDLSGSDAWRFAIHEAEPNGTDQLQFDNGVQEGDIRFFRIANGNLGAEDLQIWIGDDLITVYDQYIRTTGEPDARLESLLMADGTTLIDITGGLTFTGTSAAETVVGTTLDDTLIGLAGADILRGYAGTDTADYSASDTAVTVNLTTGVNTGGHAEGDTLFDIENLTGSAFNDRLTGDNLTDNVIRGGDGNDTLYGRGGADSLYGDNGDDKLNGGLGADYLEGGFGFDAAIYDLATSAINVSLLTGTGTLGEAVGDTLVSIERVVGTDFDDVIEGDNGSNRLEGGDGDDILSGLGGFDKILGGAGADVMDGGADFDTVTYEQSTAAVQINLTTGIHTGGYAVGDTLSNFERVAGSDFNDTLTGSSGTDRLEGAGGDDMLFGMGGNDILYGNEGADAIDGGSGRDIVYYDRGTTGVVVDLLAGSGSAGEAAGDTYTSVEIVKGSHHADTLWGAAGFENLFGNDGDDILGGRAGDDTIQGQGGADTFVIEAGWDKERIKDFENGIDKFDVSDFGLTQADAVSMAFVFGSGWAINFGGGDVLIVENASLADVSTDDFIV